MAIPATEPLIIFINGVNLTDYIPVSSVRIVEERGTKVGSADFVIENGAALGLSQWQEVKIFSFDYTVVHFNGYIMEISPRKQGIQINYDINCADQKIRLQKSIVTGTFTGTQSEILSALLAATYPDLSSIFDFSAGVSDTFPTDLSLELSESTLLDALDKLAGMSGDAPYSMSQDGVRVNLMPNPELQTDMTYYTGEIKPEAETTYATLTGWNSSNVTWGGSYGESGGGIQIVSQSISGGYYGTVGIGASSAAGQSTIRVESATNRWVVVSFRAKLTAGVSGTPYVQAELAQEDENGNQTGIGIYDSVATPTLTTSWQTFSRAMTIDGYPNMTRATVYLFCNDNGSGAFTVVIDKVLVEIVESVSKPTAGAYFDGDTSGAEWTGTAHDSPSLLGPTQLDWGTSDNAAFDVDIDSGSELFEDFEWDWTGADGINSVVVTGGYEYIAVDWLYGSFGNSANFHFSLELPIYPMDGETFPKIYRNTNTDVFPVWDEMTVTTRQDGTGEVLYDLENHWIEFTGTAPQELDKAFRVVGRFRQRIRTIVTDDASITATGVELTDKIYIEDATAEEAYALGQSELERRKPAGTASWTTYNPGLHAGDEIDLTDSAYGLSAETVVIQRVTKTYLGGGYGKFEIEAGKFQPGMDDIMYETRKLSEPKIPASEAVKTVVLSEAVDVDGTTYAVDVDGVTHVLDVGVS